MIILKVSGASWAWAVQVEDMQHDMRASFNSLLQFFLITMCQCNLHQLACSTPFVAWSNEATAAAARGDTGQVLRCLSPSFCLAFFVMFSRVSVQLGRCGALFAAHVPHVQGIIQPVNFISIVADVMVRSTGFLHAAGCPCPPSAAPLRWRKPRRRLSQCRRRSHVQSFRNHRRRSSHSSTRGRQRLEHAARSKLREFRAAGRVR